MDLEERPSVTVVLDHHGRFVQADAVDLIDAAGGSDQLLTLYFVSRKDPIFQHLGKRAYARTRGRGKHYREAFFFTGEQVRAAEREHEEFLREIGDV